MITTMSILIFLNFGFVLWFGSHEISLWIVKHYRLLRRYFDPSFMVKSKLDEDLSGNLPPVYEPFNALEDLVDNSNSSDLESISEEKSNDL